MNENTYYLISTIISGLIAVGGFSAFLIYFAQRKNKHKEEASLIVNQIDEIRESIQMVSGFINDKQINLSAVYESLPFLNENYWEKYKHNFIAQIDKSSYAVFNSLYNYAIGIQGQLEVLRNIQRNNFFVIQNLMGNMQSQLLLNEIEREGNNFMQGFDWNNYNFKKTKLIAAINQNALLDYTPLQITLSLEKLIKSYTMLEVTSCEGYRKLKEISEK